MLLEPNNIIAEATDTQIDFATEASVTVSGTIGTVSDVDLYQFQLDRGQGITLDVDTIATNSGIDGFDSFLRVFDRLGNELAFNDDSAADSGSFSLDSYAGFIANQPGEYYVGISSTGNQSYDPVDGENPERITGNFSSGDYDLTFELVDVVADADPDSTIAAATTVALNPATQTAIAIEEIETRTDVDFYHVAIAEGEGINLNLSAADDDSSFDAYLRLFDVVGNELAFNDDNSDLETATTDAAIAFVPPRAGKYFIGVSSAGNFDYDETNGNTNLNFSTNRGVSTGAYRLEVEVAEVVADNDPDNTIDEAIASRIRSSADEAALLAGEIDSELDVDFYQLAIEEGEGVNLAIATEGLDSELDSFLRLFDEQGNELSFDDNNDANFTGSFSADANLSFVPDAPGTYYAAVGASGNSNYDPINGRTNFSVDVVSPFTTTGAYELGIDVLAVQPDNDPDNILAEALPSGVSSQGRRQIQLEGELDTTADADVYRFQLDEGDGVTINLNTAGLDSELDSYLRLFDSEGNELAFDNDDDFDLADDSGTDSLLKFAPAAAGNYFLGVSSDGNVAYDVVNGNDNFTPTTGFSRGSYEVEIEITEVVADTDPDNTIVEAIATTLNAATPSITLNDAIETAEDIDLYEVQLELGDTVSFDIDTATDNRLDTFIKVFDAEGNELGSNDDGSAPDENSSLDSYLEFTAVTQGEYFFGVSSFGNLEYDPLNGSNNFSHDIGATTGNYELAINLIDSVNAIEGTATDDTLNGTAGADLILGLPGDDTLNGAAEADNLKGGLGNDSLFGGNGNDLLQGDAGNDTLSGGGGDDILDGDRGRDRLAGNGGADIFVIGANDGSSNIVDFETGSDKIALVEGLSFADLTLGSTETDTLLIAADKVIGTLANIEPSQITAADFLAFGEQ